MKQLSTTTHGAALVEYGILVGLLAVLAIGTILALGERTATSFLSPAAILDWYVGGVSDDFAARYQFTPVVDPDQPERTGFFEGEYGEVDEKTADLFDVISIQHDTVANQVEVVMEGNTVSQTPGYELSCLDLTQGTEVLYMDFDEVPGFFFGLFGATSYAKLAPTPPFDSGQELSCTITEK